MKILFTALTIISGVLMIIVILLQQGKGADLGSAFGRGSQGGLFTATGKANFLTRTTSFLVFIFLFSCLVLSLFLGDSSQDGVLDELKSGDETTITAPVKKEDSGQTNEIPE